ncbi:hypothetical protein [Campylobacter ureolyticus]|uniref:Uncharacterized protein n=1 Tax=Campylobacter ureolyticus TaxID=827 RepID=A0A6N2S226_9BACT
MQITTLKANNSFLKNKKMAVFGNNTNRFNLELENILDFVSLDSVIKASKFANELN